MDSNLKFQCKTLFLFWRVFHSVSNWSRHDHIWVGIYQTSTGEAGTFHHHPPSAHFAVPALDEGAAMVTNLQPIY